MKIVILGGAAHMARPAAQYLAAKEEISHLVLADLNLDRVEKFAEELGPKATAKQLDITNTEDLIKTINDANLVMNFIGPYYQFGTKTIETVIEEGIHYIDICDDYDTIMEALTLTERAEEKNVTALIGMGVSPGITNVLARLGSDALDEIEEINTYWVIGDAEPGGFGALIHFFHCIEGKVPTYHNGAYEQIKPFQENTSRTIDFGDPVGKVTLYHIGHPEPVTLPKFIPNVQTVTNFGAILPQSQNLLFKTIVDFGLASEETIKFRNEDVTPLEFLLAFIDDKQAPLRENTNSNRKSVGASRVEVLGKKSGKKAKITFTKSSYETMANSTSLPAGVAAWLLLKGEIDKKGVIPPECIDPKKLLLNLRETEFFSSEADYIVDDQLGEDTKVMGLFESDLFN